ncbi:MAG: caspase family protein, partial [Spirochaetia bacterium]|nr:caspase family protein [Spirochaetia bacterium]
LNNSVNDANDMKTALEGLGFSVDRLVNAGRVQMEEAVERFKNRLKASKNAYGFLFYAGHGVQSGGENYLIPVDADIRSEAYLRDRAVSVQAVLDELNAAGNALNIVVLDACRDNPFAWGRGGGRGLQVVSNQPADSIIVYATSPGSAAADASMDGTGRTGLFTGHLLKHIKNPGLEVNEVFRLTGGDVAQASGGKQRPGVYNQFYGVAYLGAKPAAQTPAARPAGGSTITVQPATTVPPAPAQPQSTAKVYKIGDIGPAGGWVFHDKGSYSDGWRYLEAAPRDAGKAGWGLRGKDLAGTGTAVGTGKRNTQLILEALRQSGETGKAAQLCAAFEAAGFKGWFLPSRDELVLMYKNLKARDLGNLSYMYWSSSQRGSNSAWFQYVADDPGFSGPFIKSDRIPVRAVRAF